RHCRSADEQLVELGVPQEGTRLAAQIAAVLGLFLYAVSCRFACLTPLAGTGDTAGVRRRPGLQIDLGVSAQQISGKLLAVDANAAMQRVVDDVLFEGKSRVENVVPGGPADFDAV